MSVLQTTLYDLLGGSTVLDKKNNVLIISWISYPREISL